MKSIKCVLCTTRTKPQTRRTINEDVKKYLKKSFLIEVQYEDTICTKCLLLYQKDKHTSREPDTSKPIFFRSDTQDHESDNDSTDDSDYVPPKRRKFSLSTRGSKITIPITSTSTSHAYCFACKKPGPKLQVVSAQMRLSTFIDCNVLIPEGSRCCPVHIKDGKFFNEVIRDLKTSDWASLTDKAAADLIAKLRDIAIQKSSTRIDFDNPHSLDDSDYKILTGLSKDKFEDLTYYVKSIRNTPSRSARTSLAIFLMKLKSGMSNRLLSILLNISKYSIRRAVSSVRKTLAATFVPHFLGFNHISRETVISDHTRPLAQTIFGDISNSQAILVLDGTYIYIQKSNNFHFQRRSYSLHKGRPLVKPMVVVTTSGYFVTVVGPYLADSKNNDASILNHMLKSNVEEMKEWVNEEDVFIVDRGFRDSLELLDDLGIQAKMPAFLKKGEKQMTTEDANMSRLVTKVRWVVESANSRIKNWKYLDKTLPTNQVPFIGDYVKIVCAIANKYCPDLSVTDNREEDIRLACKMLHMSKQMNSLKAYVEQNDLDKRSAKWIPANEAALQGFPKLDDEQLRNITCGTYQLKLSSSYIQEHIDGESLIHVHQEESNIVRVRIQSRHVSSKTYMLWIKYNSSEIESTYCKCRAGARVVGVCSHIASMLWFLGSPRGSNQVSYGVRDWGEYLDDAARSPEILDESENESITSGIEE